VPIGARRLAVLLILVARILPTGMLAAAPISCPVRALTGRPCPTCGMTRSWSAASRLRFRESVGYHPLGPMTLLGAGVIALTDDEDRSRWARDHRAAVGTAIGIWLAVWLVRLRRAG
jgi:Protein of unknown function (DUF2752)